MKKIYYLASCSTCNRILKDIDARNNDFLLQDIKIDRITPAQLDTMSAMAGSYEALFSRRALKYREQGLQNKELDEKDLRKLILEEYTFLKRPVAIVGNSIFVGSEKNTMIRLNASLR